MEMSASPGVEAARFHANGLEGFEIEGKYRIGVCLAEGYRQGLYETFHGEQPANVKLIGPETAENASDLLAGFAAGQRLRHPHLLEIYDFGQFSVNGTHCVYVVTERPDENLAGVLRERALDETETRQILDGVIPALEFLHEQGYVHGRVKPAEVLACGETVKLNAAGVWLVSAGRHSGDSSGLYAAPETANGKFGPAADAWSLAVLTLESLTRSPYMSEIDRLRAPFREMVEGGLRGDPEVRWTVRQMGLALAGSQEHEHELPREEKHAAPRVQEVATPFAKPPVPQAKYRRFAGLAVGGALAAAAVCVLLIRSAHQAPVAAPVTI
jgi:serine/threonine protein kinase